MTTHSSIDDYIAAASPDAQGLLRELRDAVRAAAPAAVETISYGMPAFAQNGTLLTFAALKNGIGVYPTSSGVAAFPSEVSPYVSTKGALRFPLDQPLPIDLIVRIVRFRVEENERRATQAATPTRRRTRQSTERHQAQGHPSASGSATSLPSGLGGARDPRADCGWLYHPPIARRRASRRAAPTAWDGAKGAGAAPGGARRGGAIPRIDHASHRIIPQHQHDDDGREDANDHHAPCGDYLRGRRR